MQDFKTPVSRLARLFKKARDNWKQKALERLTNWGIKLLKSLFSVKIEDTKTV